MTGFRAAILVTLLLSILAAPRIHAQQMSTRRSAGEQSERVWKKMDDCKREAWKQNHDYTAEGVAARDRVLRYCLEAGNLPPISVEPPANHMGLPSASR